MVMVHDSGKLVREESRREPMNLKPQRKLVIPFHDGLKVQFFNTAHFNKRKI
jgi:hypothetical protein